MKILMIHPHQVYSKIEPWTVRIINFAKEFVKKGHQVKIVYFPLEYKIDAPFSKDGIDYYPFPRKASLNLLFRNCLSLSRLAHWSDIIHFQKCFHYASLPSLFSSWRLNKPIHYDWDDWEEMIYYDCTSLPSKPVGFFIRTFEKVIPTIVDTISVTSDRLRDLCLSFGVAEDKIFLVPVGVDLEKFNPSISGERIKRQYNISHPLVLYLGQLNGAQYAEMFIKAFCVLVKNSIETDFMIVGDGVKANELRALAKRLKLDQKIIFTGAVEHDEVPGYIAASDITVACFEDNEITRCKSPLKIAEYLASGKPIVASDVGEIRDMVNGCGILTKPGDAYSLSRGIIKLLSDEQLRKELGSNARKRAEDKYNWTATAENLLSAYKLALRK